MGTIISVANQKGGVGKTTVSLNLGYALAKKGYDTLLIDMDPQFSLSFALIEMKVLDRDRDIGDLLLMKRVGKEDVNSATVKVDENLYLIPAHPKVSMVEKELMNMYIREHRLRRVVEAVHYHYDYIIIDNPPSLGILTINSLTASDYVLIPVELSYFSIIAVQLMFGILEDLRDAGLAPDLRVLGFVANKFTRQSKVPQIRLEQLRELYPDVPVIGVLPRAIAVEKSQEEGKPVFEFDVDSPFSKEFMKIVDEVVRYAKKDSRDLGNE